MFYEKCIRCKHACRCCASHFLEGWPKCSKCAGRDEFKPAVHIGYCPMDAAPVKRSRYNIDGTVMKEV